MTVSSGHILDAGAGYSTYTWSTGEITQTISVTNSGTYSVSVVTSVGCVGADTINISIDITGVEELAAEFGVKVYPNPSEGVFTIKAVKNNKEVPNSCN